MDKRLERMLEEVVKLPGNETCADCRAPAPRWASVNIGIFICVGCASVHRKLGTHKSRVKSVTLDTWTREQIAHMRAVGNAASNRIWNPDERMHPPPASSIADERDGEMEKFIRRKYEQGAFKAGATAGGSSNLAPTSLNRARERDGRLPSGISTGARATDMSRTGSYGSMNQRNPELNDILVSGNGKEKELPNLPLSPGAPAINRGVSPKPSIAPPRQRPSPTGGNTPQSTGLGHTGSVASGNGGSLIDLGEGTSATRPFQGYGALPSQGIMNGSGQTQMGGVSPVSAVGQPSPTNLSIGMGNPWANQSYPVPIAPPPQQQHNLLQPPQQQIFDPMSGAGPSSYSSQQQFQYQSAPEQYAQLGNSYGQQQQAFLQPQQSFQPGPYGQAQSMPIQGQMGQMQHMVNGQTGMGMGSYGGSSPNGAMMGQVQMGYGQMVNGGQSPGGYQGMGGMQFGNQAWQQGMGTVYGQGMR